MVVLADWGRFVWAKRTESPFLKMQKVQGILALVCLISLPFIVPLSSVLSLSRDHHQKRDIQCGLNAPPGQETCSVGMCCSRYGFCGETDDHCGLGCQGSCRETATQSPIGHAPGKLASCPGTTSMNRSIAYYESWASHRPCDIYMPSDIDPTPYTHINFAFALVDKDTSKVALSLQNDTILYDQMKKLRSSSKHLELWIAVGGYAVGAAPFSKLAASSAGRSTFVDSICSFMDQYGFDGMDLDWEYPGATDMGGSQSDGANLVLLLQEYRAKCKNKGLSVTVPGGLFYMTGFNLQGIEPYVDWLNVMTYDLHGSWETPILAQPHTNLSDISQSLKKVWDAKINPQKVIMGLAYYGKTYTLSSSSCTGPGCAAKGPGNPGPCSNEGGSLYNSEIETVLSQDSSIKPTLDKTAAVKYFTWNKDQWVSYDDAETRKLKMEYAAQNCLGGTLAWAVDMSSLGKPKDGLGL